MAQEEEEVEGVVEVEVANIHPMMDGRSGYVASEWTVLAVDRRSTGKDRTYY